MCLKKSNVTGTEIAQLFSPKYLPNTEIQSCISFWYYMSGKSNGLLKLVLKSYLSYSKEMLVIDSNFGDLGNTWRYAHVTLPAMSTFWLLFEGSLKDPFTGLRV